MKPRDCCLIIVFPKALEEELVDHLLEHPEWVTGFVIGQLEGTGQTVPLHGVAELVRGRSPRVQVQVVINREDAQALVAHFKESLPSKEVAYWTMPVLEFGRFA